MRGVDQRIDPLAQQIIRKAGDAAETADANRHRLTRGRSGAAGERQRNVEVTAARQLFRQQPRFGGSSENENLCEVFRHVAS